MTTPSKQGSRASRVKPVGFYVPSWPLSEASNGIVSYVAAMRCGLEAIGIHSLVFAPRAPRPGEIDVVGLDRKRPLLARARRLWLRLIKHPHAARSESSLRLQALVQQQARLGLTVLEMEESFGQIDEFRVPGVSRVARLHGPWFLNGQALGVPEDDAYRARVRAEGIAIERADAISAPAKDVLDRVRNYYGLSLPHARVVPNPGPEVSREQTWNPSTAKANQILFVGRFDRHKGGDLVLDAFVRLGTEFPDLELVFAGPDRGLSLGHGRVIQLDEYVAANVPRELRPRLHLLGHTTPERIAELRRESALCIVASRYETFSMVTVEAIGFGCPVVAARTGGIPDIVRHERTGLLFDPDNAQDLAQQVRRLLTCPEQARELARNGRSDYEARYAPNVVARAMLDFYLSIPNVRLDAP